MSITKKPTLAAPTSKRPALPTQPETPEAIAPSLGLSPYRLRRISRAYKDFPQPVFVTGPATHTRYYYDPKAVRAFVEHLFDAGIETNPRGEA